MHEPQADVLGLAMEGDSAKVQVLQVRDGVLQDRQSFFLDTAGGEDEDTVLVRPNGGSVTFRTRFEDFVGTVAFHCHFVTHSDLGMMGVFDVVDPSSTPDPPPVSGGLFCRL